MKNGIREGLRLMFEDQVRAFPTSGWRMKDGYTTGSGLGLGLSGSKRLVNDFEIKSSPGQGTTVTITRWK